MIYDNIENASVYYNLGPRFEKALEFLKNYKGQISLDKISIDGNDVFATIQNDSITYEKNPDQWECHQKFADIQFMFNGEEMFGFAQTRKLTPLSDYDSSRDIQFLKSAGSENYLTLCSGDFVIVFPQDAHSPSRHPAGGMQKNWRVVVKVRL